MVNVKKCILFFKFFLAAIAVLVDNVEILTGMVTEKTTDDTVPTFTLMMNSFIVNSIVTNPFHSKSMWKPDTFDDDFGFSLVKSASIRTFICNNLHDEWNNDEFIVFILNSFIYFHANISNSSILFLDFFKSFFCLQNIIFL
jgi:hypothetical protein